MRNHILLATGLFCLTGGYAFGSCTGSSPYACTGGSISIPQNTNQTGTISSSSQTLSGLAGTISKISVTLNNWTDDTTNGNFSPADADREMMLVFQPTGCTTSSCLQTFQFLGGFGSYQDLNSETVTFDDSATSFAPGFSDGNPPNPATYKPTVNEGTTYCSAVGGNAAFQSPAPSSAPCAAANSNDGPSDGSATFTTGAGAQFSGSPNGTWTLYVETWHNGADATASIGS